MTVAPRSRACEGDPPKTPRVREGVPRLALSPDEAAAAISVSRDYFDEHVRPALRVVRLGRRIIVPVRELEKWLAANASCALGDEA